MENEVITFDPAIEVPSDKIVGGTTITSAEIRPKDASGMVIAQILPIGIVIAVPFIESNEESIRQALS